MKKSSKLLLPTIQEDSPTWWKHWVTSDGVAGISGYSPDLSSTENLTSALTKQVENRDQLTDQLQTLTGGE